jgi:uncharacterized repeat protein (TIGR03837 family)
MLWNIFCEVIDNHGDLGVCWRLSADLAGRGEQVRLWVDQPDALQWMAPHGCAGVEVRPWSKPLPVDALLPGDVMVEAFGCELPAEFVAWRATQGPAPVWINLEYMSAESYVERSHGLQSPVSTGPAAGWRKWFFYPGFTRRTGGLLREPDLLARQARFDRMAWRQTLMPRLDQGSGVVERRASRDAEQWISLFCYEPPALPALLAQLQESKRATRLLVTPGRATQAVRGALDDRSQFTPRENSHLAISFLPALTQREFDELLWACDFNFVRGEDSAVRALWAGKPFAWHIYPQDDQAHHAKLDAMLDLLDAPPSLRRLHHIWNAVRPASDGLPPLELDGAWQSCITEARTHLLSQPDLAAQLLQFVQERR